MNLQAYQHWIAVARRHSRVADEAEDLLQEALVVAARQERLDLTVEDNRRWLTGVLRNLAARAARDAVRRKHRERDTAESAEAAHPPGTAPGPLPAWIDAMPTAARRVLVLALHGLTAAEIQSALSLSPTAYRQRLTSVRKHLGELPDDLQRDALALAYDRRTARGDDLALGLVRRALLRRLREDPHPHVGTHDPDGHLIVFSKR